VQLRPLKCTYIHTFLGSLTGLQIRALAGKYDSPICRDGPPCRLHRLAKSISLVSIFGLLKFFTNSGSPPQ
jgi:hypothetical protein